MAVEAGSRLGPYEIVSRLGAGGMGEVFRARDSRLNREVALKVLPREFSADSNRRARFEREAKAAAALNHPNILGVYDIGEQDGVMYIISELVAGETLGAMLERGPVGARKLLDIAVQLADGMSAAHAAGITHRDLKPANIMITSEGRVKILDFGLARQTTRTARTGETAATALSDPGMIVGTAHYMSPEQARGLEVDHRSDQFSFGLILYHMAAGKKAFDNPEPIAVMMAIVNDDAPPIERSIPTPLKWTIERCLAKEPNQRFASTTDLCHQLRDLRDHISEMASSAAGRGLQPARPLHQRVAPWAILAAVLIVGFLLGAFLAAPGGWQVPALQFTPVATEGMNETQPAWSPDGQNLAYIANVGGRAQVFARALNSPIPAQITNAPAACANPFWSADGTRVYFTSGSILWSVGAAGGEPQQVTTDANSEYSPDGKTMASFRCKQGSCSVWIGAASGAQLSQYRHDPFPASFRFSRHIRFSPDGKKLLVVLEEQVGPAGGNAFWVIPLPDGKPRRTPYVLPDNLQQSGFSWLRDNRTVVFGATLPDGFNSHLYTLDTESGAVKLLTGSTGAEGYPAVSPDGKRIAFSSGLTDSDLSEIWTNRTSVSPALATSRQERMPDWAPSGLQYAYVTNSHGDAEIWLRSVAEGWAKPLVTANAEGALFQAAPKISPDGKRIAYMRIGPKHSVWISQLAGGREVPLEQECPDQHSPAWSPDGNWIVYNRYINGRWEVAKAPSGGAGKPVSVTEGGISTNTNGPQWSPSGEWILFVDAGGLRLVSPEGGTSKLLYASVPATFGFSKDGKRVYIVRREDDRRWLSSALSVPDGAETKLTDLDLPVEVTPEGFSLHPDGNRFITATISNTRDIWILDGFSRTGGWLDWLRRR